MSPLVLLAVVAAVAADAGAPHGDPLPRELDAPTPGVTYAPPRPVDTAAFGARITRTMSLLATSTPARRNRVKVLVYGQSISKQTWAREVEADLRRRFPDAELVFENRSIGGFISGKLRRTLEHDVIPFYPDLVIFHVYGNEIDYEAVIREIRTRTTAEVIVSNDHVTTRENSAERERHGWIWMPELARRWGLELADARRAWLDYLTDNRLTAAALVAPDGTHLGPRGNFLLAEVIKRHLRHDGRRAADPDGHVRTLVVGRDVRWKRGRLVLPFDGNRVDVLAARAAAPGDGFARVLIDGAPPARQPSLHALSRPNADPNRDWPWEVGALIRVDRRAPLLVEDWTVRLTEVAPGARGAAFDLFGSVTGFDGSGRTEQPFVSRSGRVALSPEDWFLAEPASPRFKVPIRRGFRITWRVVPQYTDPYAAPAWIAPGDEAAQTLVQGLPRGPHRLELIAADGAPPPIAAIRIYRPPYR